MKSLIKIKIEKIAAAVKKGIINGGENEGLGLYSGKLGILLFLYYYSKYSKDPEYIELTDQYTDILLEKLVERKTIHAFCNGYSGILYLIEFLRLNDFVDIDIEEVEPIFEEFILQGTSFDIKNGHYDFMHGALGSGFYFLKKKTHPEEIDKLIEYLYQTAEKDGNIFRWKSSLGISGEVGYNIALSHGISSIIIFLSRLKANHFNNTYLDELLEGAVNYVLSQEIDPKKYGCYFPSQSKDKLWKSRLGWCYGDLGVALALWQTGKVNSNEEWRNKALEVFTFSANRLSIQDAMTQDAGICHGSAGIAMFFNRIYKETGHELFLTATTYWIEETLRYATFEDGLVGYKTYTKEIDINPDYSLLTGITGIGLVLLSYITQDKQKWDELFLLS